MNHNGARIVVHGSSKSDSEQKLQNVQTLCHMIELDAVPPILHFDVVIALNVIETGHLLCILGPHKAERAPSPDAQNCARYLNIEVVLYVR